MPKAILRLPAGGAGGTQAGGELLTMTVGREDGFGNARLAFQAVDDARESTLRRRELN